MCNLSILNLEIAFHKMPVSALWEAMGESKTVQETKQKQEKERKKDSDLCTQVWAGFETESMKKAEVPCAFIN